MIERERKGKGTGTLSLEFISDRDDVPVPPSHPIKMFIYTALLINNCSYFT